MILTIPNDVLTSTELNASDKLLFAYLLNLADDKGQCNPHLETILQDLGSSRSTVIRSLSRLEAVGLLTKEHRHTQASLITIKEFNENN